MPSPSELCTIEHLAKIFGGCQEEIIAEWRSHADKLLIKRHLDKLSITDHLPDLVTEITADLTRRGGEEPAEEYSRDSPPRHGVQRFYEGLNVGEVVAEYNLLRVAFITVAERQGCHVVGEAGRIINQRIDAAVRMAVMAFAEQQALMRQTKEAEHLAFVAHDLRTPLNAVSILVEELAAGLDPRTMTENAEIFEILNRNLQRVETLIKQVLATQAPVSPKGGSFLPQRRTFELWAVVQRLLLDLGSVWMSQDIAMVNEVPTTLTVFADAALISQVFQNLLSNAYKYAPKGRVVVTARDDTASGTVICEVSDNGAGIPPQMLPQVFQKLATDPEKSGTGLGLTIVKQIVEAHGGTVSVESEPGQGATFRFTLPVRVG